MHRERTHDGRRGLAPEGRARATRTRRGEAEATGADEGGGRGADGRVGAGAVDAGVVGVHVVVIAIESRRAQRRSDWREHAGAGDGVAGVGGGGVVVVARLDRADAGAVDAGVIDRAGVVVVARLLDPRAGAREAVADVHRAGILVGAVRVFLTSVPLVLEHAGTRRAVQAILVTVVVGPGLVVVADHLGELADASLGIARVQRAVDVVVALHRGRGASLDLVAGVDGAQVTVVAGLGRAGAGAGLATVLLGAGVVVVARRRVDAMDARARQTEIIRAGVLVVTGLQRAGAGAGRGAGVVDGAGVVVVAGADRRHMGTNATGAADILGARFAVVAGLRGAHAALGLVAGVVGAGIPVVASFAGEDAAAGRVAGVGGARVAVVADCRGADAEADVVAEIVDGARVAVVARHGHVDVDALAVGRADVGGADVAIVAVAARARGGGAVVGLVHVGAGVAGVLRVLGRDAGVDGVGAAQRGGRLRGAFATPEDERHAQGGGHLIETLLHDVSYSETQPLTS